jgi:hypothetical protein
LVESIRLFVRHFFSCRECSRNFEHETHDFMSHLHNHPGDGVLYLWKVHNKVNKRLAASEKQGVDDEEDPLFPKRTFPTKAKCPLCYAENDEQHSDHKQSWNVKHVLDYLIGYYSAVNILPIDYMSDHSRYLLQENAQGSSAAQHSSNSSNQTLNLLKQLLPFILINAARLLF